MHLFRGGGLQGTALEQVQLPGILLRTGDGKFHIHRTFILGFQHLQHGVHHADERVVVHNTLTVRKVNLFIHVPLRQHVLGLGVTAQHQLFLPFGKQVDDFIQLFGAKLLVREVQHVHLPLGVFVAVRQGGPQVGLRAVQPH